MIGHAFRTRTLMLAGCALLVCAGAPRPAPAGNELAQRFQEPEDLIQALARTSRTEVTRLNPEYILDTLAERAEDEKIAAAFEHAMQVSGAEAKYALIRALELKFIHDPEASALDLLGPELSEHFRGFDWQYGDYPGGPEGPNETFADVMVDALDIICPERRANSQRYAVVRRQEATEEVWEYMTNEWVPIPGEDRWKLNRHACEAFVRMREQARMEGVEMAIRSAHRDRAVAERNAARAGNPAAVASFSSHSLGLAIDFQMSHGDLEFAEVTTRPMSEVVRMRESPVHKWLVLRGHEFGWFPYQNEPWHWEYNPVGFRPIFWSNFPGGDPSKQPAPEPEAEVEASPATEPATAPESTSSSSSSE